MTTKKTTALRQRMTEDLQLAGFSERTQDAYVQTVRKLAAHYGPSPDQLTEAQVRDYLLFLKNERKFSPRALKIAHSDPSVSHGRTGDRALRQRNLRPDAFHGTVLWQSALPDLPTAQDQELAR
jgi:Phage integrase, N-terminal SAM-like domain